MLARSDPEQRTGKVFQMRPGCLRVLRECQVTHGIEMAVLIGIVGRAVGVVSGRSSSRW